MSKDVLKFISIINL